jgi:hypothetical protein
VSSAVILGSSTIYIGSGAGGTVSVSDVVAIGLRSGTANTKDGLVAIGRDSALNNTGNNTVAIGLSAGINNIGNANVCVGLNAGANMRDANGNNVAIGPGSGVGAGAIRSVMIGVGAGSSSTLANDTVAIGTNACIGSHGSSIVGFGVGAAFNNSGSAVVALGSNAGYGNTGSNCVFLGSNGSPSITNVSPHTFLVYSAQTNNNPPPFLRGDMSANTLGIGKAPVAGFGLAIEGSIQNRINISTVTSSPLILTPANAATRFFVSAAVTLSFVSLAPRDIGTHWIVTNTSTNTVAAGLSGGTVFGLGAAVTLPATSGGLGRGITFAYSGAGSNFFAF